MVLSAILTDRAGIELIRFLTCGRKWPIVRSNVASSKRARKARHDFGCNKFHSRPFFGKSYHNCSFFGSTNCFLVMLCDDFYAPVVALLCCMALEMGSLAS